MARKNKAQTAPAEQTDAELEAELARLEAELGVAPSDTPPDAELSVPTEEFADEGEFAEGRESEDGPSPNAGMTAEEAFDAPLPDYADPNAVELTTPAADDPTTPDEDDGLPSAADILAGMAAPSSFADRHDVQPDEDTQATEDQTIEEAQATVDSVDWSKVAAGNGTGFGVDHATPGEVAAGEDPLANVNAAMNNVTFTKKDFDKEVKKFGEQYGQGANSLPALALRGIEAAQRIPEIGPKDAEAIISVFNDAAGKKATLEYKRGASFKVQVSKFRQFLEIAGNPKIDAYEVAHRAVDVIRGLSKDPESGLTNSLYENLVKFARKQKQHPNVALTDDQIRDAVIPNTAEKSEMEKLNDLLSKVRKAHDWAPQDSKLGLEDAAHAIEDAIKAAGGTPPAK